MDAESQVIGRAAETIQSNPLKLPTQLGGIAFG
jgi:hypothetical protein